MSNWLEGQCSYKLGKKMIAANYGEPFSPADG